MVKYKVFSAASAQIGRRLVVVLLLAAGWSGGANADNPPQLLKGFRYPEYDQQGRLTMEVMGDEALLQADGLIRITNLKMVLYEEGKPVTEVMAPECLFDRTRSAANSTSTVTIVRSEVILTGEGFSWNADDGCFQINRQTRVFLKNTVE
ncbi:MAG: LPS export ABC transporter periplasmic protein LptC [Kiritimatiellia bacterium]|nr:LPS export ABC transporter periplasmic protein LptC [Lentisphaerota bacterium]